MINKIITWLNKHKKCESCNIRHEKVSPYHYYGIYFCDECYKKFKLKKDALYKMQMEQWVKGD